MQPILPLLIGSLLAAAPATALAQGRSIADLAGDNANKRIVLEYLDLAWRQGRRPEARAKYFAPTFRNYPDDAPKPPVAGAPLRPPLPAVVKYEFLQVIAEGDFVVVHSMVRGFGLGEPVTGMFASGGPKVGDDVVDIFKVLGGKIVGKSDTVQASEREDISIPD